MDLLDEFAEETMTAASLKIETEDRNGIQVLHVSGPLDSITHDDFQRQVDALMIKTPFRLVMDCESITYVNSRGLALLAHYQRSSAKTLSFFGLAGLNPRIGKAIEMLGMTKLIKVYPTLEEALAVAQAL